MLFLEPAMDQMPDRLGESVPAVPMASGKASHIVWGVSGAAKPFWLYRPRDVAVRCVTIRKVHKTFHLYSTTGNTVPACFGASRPGSNPATSQSAASV